MNKVVSYGNAIIDNSIQLPWRQLERVPSRFKHSSYIRQEGSQEIVPLFSVVSLR